METQKNLPSNFHIGMPKTGSSFLYSLLKQHPDVILGKNQKINFYSSHFSNGFDWYFSLFEKRKGIIIDTSPKMFMLGDIAPEKIAKYVSEPKFLLILRNPVTYVYSHYKMHYNKKLFLRNHKNKFTKNPSFKEVIDKYPDYLNRGKYYEMLRVWMSYFDNSAFKIVVFEDFVKFPQKYMDEIFDFFKLSKIKIQKVNESSKNAALKGPFFFQIKKLFLKNRNLKDNLKKIKFLDRLYDKFLVSSSVVPEKYIEFLFDFYDEDIQKLQKQLQLDLSCWYKLKNENNY